MADQTLDARRLAREQENRIAAVSAVALNAVRPLMQYQISVLRLWADHVEMFVRNYEKGLETFSAAVEEQWQRAA